MPMYRSVVTTTETREFTHFVEGDEGEARREARKLAREWPADTREVTVDVVSLAALAIPEEGVAA